MTLTNLETHTPVEIDTEIVRLMGEERAAATAIERAVHDIQFHAGDRGTRHLGSYSYRPLQENVDILNAKIAAGDAYARSAQAALDAFEAARKQYREASAAILPLQAEHRRRGWTRVFVVNNVGGHAHRTMGCPETYSTTEFNWRPDYSDKTDAEIVQAAGRLTCLTCFRSVREQILALREDHQPAADLVSDKDQERAKNAAELAARKSAKAAKDALKGITMPDGTKLTEENSSYPIGSWTTAQQNLVAQLGDEAGARAHGGDYADRYDRNEEFVARLVAALAHKGATCAEVAAKVGTTPDEVMAIAQSKVKGYVKRHWQITL